MSEESRIVDIITSGSYTMDGLKGMRSNLRARSVLWGLIVLCMYKYGCVYGFDVLTFVMLPYAAYKFGTITQTYIVIKKWIKQAEEGTNA